MLPLRTEPDSHCRFPVAFSSQRLWVLAVLALSLLLPTAGYAKPSNCQHVPDAVEVRYSYDALPESKKPYPHALLEYGAVFTAKKFLSLYLSDNPEDRRFAEFFMVGVVQATEGKGWCDAKKLKTDTLLSALHTPLLKLDESKCNERAADVISHLLHDFSPCQE
jgi:hypothetical protein